MKSILVVACNNFCYADCLFHLQDSFLCEINFTLVEWKKLLNDHLFVKPLSVSCNMKQYE